MISSILLKFLYSQWSLHHTCQHNIASYLHGFCSFIHDIVVATYSTSVAAKQILVGGLNYGAIDFTIKLCQYSDTLK